MLEPLFKFHPLWPRMKAILTEGVDFPLENLSRSKRNQDLKDALEFGNHKGALKNAELLHSKLETEVKHAFALPIPLDHILDIDGALWRSSLPK